MLGPCFVIHCFVSFLVLRNKELVAVIVLCLYLIVPWVGLQCVIVVFPGHNYLLSDSFNVMLIL